MVNKGLFRSFLPILLIFLISTSLLIVGIKQFSKWNIDVDVLVGANVILFAATALSFYFYYQALRNNNAHAFLRFIYGGMFIKMMICLFAAFIYIMLAGKSVNKGAVMAALLMYFLYTFVEIAVLMKLSKQNKNAKAGSPS